MTTKEKLNILAEDELLLQAIQEAFIEQIDKAKPDVGKGDNDTHLGQKYRAYEKAKDILMNTITEIKSYKNNQKTKTAFNKAK